MRQRLYATRGLFAALGHRAAQSSLARLLLLIGTLAALFVPTLVRHVSFAANPLAANDDMRQPEAKDVLRAAFAKAKLKAEVEVYEGAQHGWCPPDSQVYNHDAAEKAWSRLLAHFKSALV